MAFCSGLLQSVLGALRDDVALKLRERGQDAEQQLSHGRGEIETVLDADELHFRGEKLSYGDVEMLHASGRSDRGAARQLPEYRAGP